MKKLWMLLCVLTVFSIMPAMAQRFAYVDTEYILSKIPEYKTAQDQINKLSEGWQAEVEALMTEAEQLYKKYESEKVMLSEAMQAQREEEVMRKEEEAKALQLQYFGRDGELLRKQQELIKPIQDKVYQAVKDVSAEEGYSIVFDTAGGANVLYANPKNDSSDQVLKKLGYTN